MLCVLPAIATLTVVTAIMSATSTAITAAAITAGVIAAARARGAMGLEAVAAIDGTVFTRDERYGGWIATRCADGIILLATWCTRHAGLLTTTAGSAAAWAPAGGVRQSFAGVKFLFTSAKREIISAIAAGKDTVPVALIGHHG